MYMSASFGATPFNKFFNDYAYTTSVVLA